MASAGYDRDAKDLESGNKMVIKMIQEYVEKSCVGDIPPGSIKFIQKQLDWEKLNDEEKKKVKHLHEFYKNIAEGIVQVDAYFEGEVENGTKIFVPGYSWKIRITIDADTPPSSSTQKKHIGFEIDCKTKGKQTGHVWCDAVPKGRPGTGVSMEEKIIIKPETTTLPNGDTITFSLKTYSIK